MTHIALSQPRGRTRFGGAPRFTIRWLAVGLAAILALTASSGLVSTLRHLSVLEPSGEHAVGKTSVLLEDTSRSEPDTASAVDHRRIRLVAWYPAEAGSGEPAEYVEGLDRIGDGLVESGSISAVARAGLGLVTDPAMAGATVAGTDALPVILLSPGNATNVEFYAAIGQELASHGYAVVGIDHPFQGAAVDIGDQVAVYSGDPPLAEAEAVLAARMDVRLADIGFVLDRLSADATGLAGLDGRLDLDRVAVMGHSNGGIAAARACDDPRVRACLNIDGQHAAGPFGSDGHPAAPANPFLFLTREAELHPAIADAFQAGGLAGGAIRVVVPAASHDSFTDGPRFVPRLLPGASTADDVLVVTRGMALAFFDHVLRGAAAEVLGEVDAPTDIQVEVYPLQRGG